MEPFLFTLKKKKIVRIRVNITFIVLHFLHHKQPYLQKKPGYSNSIWAHLDQSLAQEALHFVQLLG
jgi:hypothetical protein